MKELSKEKLLEELEKATKISTQAYEQIKQIISQLGKQIDINFKPIKVIVHHSLTTDSGTVSWGAIRSYHTKVKEWSDIGYHAGVELVRSGGIYHYENLMGRMWNTPGAHAKWHNPDSLGICFVGDFDDHPPPEDQLKSGAKIISLWLKLFNLSIEDVFPHSRYSATSCPGKFFDMERLKQFIQ